VIAVLRGVAEEPSSVLEWFSHRAERTNDGAIPEQMWLTVWHSAFALVVVVLVAVPLAAYLAHHRRGELAASFAVSIGRAVPTVTVVGVAVIVSLRNGFGLEPWPIIVALVLLGLPPVFANTYAAVRGVDPGPVDAARAMGSTAGQVLLRVELPLALPIVIAGIRTAAVQIVATEPLGAFFGGEGLGAYLRQGLSTRDTYQVQGGALLVTAVAIAAELLLVTGARVFVPKGIRAATPKRRARRRVDPVLDAAPVAPT
jgi:osmoprotectant transport system permease protein